MGGTKTGGPTEHLLDPESQAVLARLERGTGVTQAARVNPNTGDRVVDATAVGVDVDVQAVLEAAGVKYVTPTLPAREDEPAAGTDVPGAAVAK